MQQAESEFPGPNACIAIMNEAYNLLRNNEHKAMSGEAHEVILHCQDQLRQRHIKFHLEPIGEWVLDGGPIVITDRIAL